MGDLLTQFLNIIFPPRESEKNIQEFNLTQSESLYAKNVFNGFIYLSRYDNEIVRSAILENKFHNNKKASRILGQLLDKWNTEQTLPTLFIPIPLGQKRQKQRGYNQVVEVLKTAPKSINYDTNLLMRNLETAPQTELNKVERQKNVKNAFIYNKTPTDLSLYSQVVIVDDVVTTGATLESARETLKSKLPTGTKVICLALSH